MRIGNLNLVSGIPKICVPLAERELDGLLLEAARAVSARADLVEWRADYFEEDRGLAVVRLKEALEGVPLLVTFRTVPEGGRGDVTGGEYLSLNRELLVIGRPELLDIEISSGDEICRELISEARQNGAATVLSSHNFKETPPYADMLDKMRYALTLGGDIPKLAVMPREPDDVLKLLRASARFARENPGRPAITVSMGRLGAISRISGEFFGSAVTFAPLRRSTAPGQISAEELRRIMDVLHGAV